MSKYIINPEYSLILKKNNQLLCTKNGKTKYFLVNKEEKDALMAVLNNEMFDIQQSAIFNQLLKKKVIIKCDDYTDLRNTHLYLKSYTNSAIDMLNLSNKRVLVIGLGGIGCEVITHLVGNGINYFSIMDYDVVDGSNLNRQYLFDYCDLSKSKALLVEKRIKEKNPNAFVNKYDMFINSDSQIIKIIDQDKIDIVVCAADKPFLDIRISVLKACIKTDVPCIFGGVSILSGQYGPTFIFKTKMQKYLNQLTKAKDLVQCCNINKASFGPTNSIVSAYMSMDIIMTLLNKKKYIKSLNTIRTLNFLSRVDNEEKKF